MSIFLISRRTAILTVLLSLLSISLNAQSKLPTLTKKDYDQWQSLRGTWISEHGSWAAWQVARVEGNDTLYIKQTDGKNTYEFGLASNLQFSKDEKWAAFRIGYPEKELEKKREKNETIKYKMTLLNLETGDEEKFEEISSFRFSESSGHLVMVAYKPKGIKHKGKDIILRNLLTGQTRNIGNVSEWAFNKKGTYLAYIIDASGKKGNGVELYKLASDQLVGIDSDTSSYLNLAWEKKQDVFAFMKKVYDTCFKEANHEVFAVKDPGKEKPEVFRFTPSAGKNLPDSMRIRETRKPVWSEDLTTVFVGIDEWTAVEKKDKGKKSDSAQDKKPKKKEKAEKLPGLDIWHWKDDPIQPRQVKTFNNDRNHTYLCAWNLEGDKLVQLTNEDYRDGFLCGDQKHALAWGKKPYQPQLRMEYADYQIIDTRTGKATKIAEKFITNYMYGSSPDGKFLLYFKEDNWWTYNIREDKHTNLTGSLDTEFWNTRYDGPLAKKPPFGRGGWLKEDQKVLLYDEFDVWAVNPDGSGATRLTAGKENEIIYRVNRVDLEEDWLDPEKDLYFRMFGDKTKNSGFARISPEGKFSELIYEDKSVHRLTRAKSSPGFIFTAESYEDSPDLFYVTESFRKPKQLSETNPQQKDFAWGKTELVSFTNENGKAMQGVLHYPANYEAGKKYPMLVYIYEIRSNNLNRYVVPSPRSAYNITNYVQQGFFVFQPDIVYTTNQPGESAVDCVVPAVKTVLETGMVDESKIGLMGHSWGAYQTSFIITQTDLFSAAVAGAPLTNMISMYNSIYWNTGTPDQRIFETGQGRFDEPYWRIKDKFEENSPLYQAENIQTPLLVAFGDKDGAVDWHQGIEMYITMRRMEKPMIMLVYAGENHGLRKKENQLDYSTKINEFFNHHLLGKDAPEWINQGMKYVDKKKKEAEQKKK